MKKVTILIICIAIFISSCQLRTKALEKISFQGEAQGTYYMVTYFDGQNRNLKKEIDSILVDFDQSLSSWVPNSILSRVNRNEENVLLDQYFTDNFNLSEKVSKETDGAFDCTVGPLIEAWGFGFREKVDIDQRMIDSILAFVGFEKAKIENNVLVKSDPRMELSFNAVAQGYSVDVVGRFLKNLGIQNFIIDIGGEVLASGSKPNSELWQVGIQKPTVDQNGEIEADVIVNLMDKALVTSGSYRKYYEKNGKRYSHMIDPSTGYPVKHSLLSVSVLADKCADADAYATAFMIMGLEKSLDFLEGRNDLDAYFIFDDENGQMKTNSTKGFESLISK
ncbi:MAG: thiamine biosynthesis protein ApbE [Bacteroidetes bacterium HGW-Bacteroidetes-17]|jgi:thiamine biosynthesis lipoprotein|nr:MAG: thiamine biosynthesis protein ApbE [Bacteroidetes bacterium HGW-Bacteroidetes-17]